MVFEIVLLVISFVFIIAGDKELRKSKRLKSKGEKVKAVVIKNNRKININNRRKSNRVIYSYYPVVEFQTEDDRWMGIELNFGTSQPKNIGENIDILYDPENPSEVSVNNFFMLSVLPWLFIVLGVCGIVFSTLELMEVIDFIN
ncbi:DUF3592 domain-containing protein [uncultured Flavobacterium sp.]|mgnify:CR=1 FL=1|uniref:DUF3592 domain-containing protein n=1 Tax=uncultured Flavobacterium sp. TaxID=165435 RepID=UPI0025E64BB8|nr:DUF3592 domain-containing protein [uncultured Flavobacterium sp.]